MGSLSAADRVTTWAALRAAGYSRAAIAAQLDAGRWRRWGHAIVLHNGPLSTRQRWMVGRVHGGPLALLTGLTAAEAYGLVGWRRDEVHLLLPRGARRLDSSPVPLRLRRVRDWSAVRRHPRAPIQARADALLVAAATLPEARTACGVLAAAVQQRVCGAEELAMALERHPRLRHRRTLITALADIEQGSQALSEIDFVRLCRRHGLPVPIRQHVRREPSGRRRYLDAVWRRADGRLVVVEVDGALHLSARRWWDDQARQNELTLTDALVLRFPSVILRTDEAAVVRQLRRALLLD